MLTRVEVKTRRGTQLTLPLEDNDSGYLVSNIEGLHPVKATLISSSAPNLPGEQSHGSKREKRPLKITLDLDPDFQDTTVESLRNDLYRYVMPESEVLLRFHKSDSKYYDIVATVEGLEPNIFSRDPAVDIDFMCFDPDFFDPNPVTEDGVSTADPNVWTEIPYLGTVRAGVLFTIRPDRTMSSFTIVQETPEGEIRNLEFAAPLQQDDVVRISTIPGNRGATLTRASTLSSILYGISPQSDWLALRQGTNKIRMSTPEFGVPWELQYVTRYGGL